MALTIGELVGYLRIDRSRWDAGIRAAREQLDRLGGGIERVNTIARVGGMALLAQQAAGLAAAAGAAAGALGAVPAAAAVYGAAAATVRVATAGMDEAMKAVAEGDAEKLRQALEELSPQARAFVQSWAGLAGQFRPIQQAVQDKLFVRLGQDLDGLSRSTLPAAGRAMGAVAAELNGLAREGVQAASSPLFAGQVEQAGRGAAAVLGEFRGAVAGIPGALLAVVNVGMPFVQQLAQMTAHVIRSATAFLSSEAGAEQMRATIQRGIDTIAQMVRIGDQVGQILSGVWRAAGVEAGGLLDSIERVSTRIAEWVNSTAGQTALHDWFDRLRQVGQHVADVLPLVVAAAGALLDVINGLPAPVKDLATQALAWSIVLGPIAGRLTGIVTAGLGLVRIVPTIASFTASVTAASARTVTSLATMAAQFVAQGARMAMSAATTAARVVAGWVLMGAQALAQAARMAAAWVVAMGPVGWVIAAVAGLVAVIIANWETVAAWTQQIWDTVWGWVRDVWQKITGWIGDRVADVLGIIDWLREIPGRIGGFFSRAKDAAIEKLTQLLDWLRGLPGRVWDAITGIGEWLYNAGRDLIQGLINGAKAMLRNLLDTVADLARRAVDTVKSWFGIASPSRVFAAIGRDLGRGLVAGIDQMGPAVTRAAERLSAAATITPPAAPALAGAPGASAAPGTAGGLGGGRAVLHIEHYHAAPTSDPRAQAEELDWLSRTGG